MERVAVVVESSRHPPAFYWCVASAAALCSLYGTFALAKRSGHKQLQNGSGVTSRVAFKKLRRKYAQKLRPLLEELVYFTMLVINLVLGVFYWVLDVFLEPRGGSAPKGWDLVQHPTRGEIKRLRTRWAWARTHSEPRQRCECWGWRVEDLVMETKGEEEPQFGQEESQQSWKQEIQSENGDAIAEIEEASSQILQDEGDSFQPRWSDCHCVQCAPLLMPMERAAESLCVLSPESFRAKEVPLSTSLSEPRNTPKPSPSDISQNKERSAVIFIHGMFSSATFWFHTDIAFHLSDDVKNRHQILAPDLLGCGRSPRPVDSLYSLADQIEAIERSVIQRYQLKSFHLVGHSMGCIIALALAGRCPQRVRSISLIAPVYPPCCLREDGELAQIPCDAFYSFLDPLTVKGARALTVCKYYNISRFIGHLLYAKHTYWVDRIHGLLKRKGYPRSFIHDYLTHYHDAAWHIAHNSLLAGTHAVIPALQKLRDSGHPILVIHGEVDTTIQFRLAEEMSRTFSNVELVGVPEKGHVDVVFGRAQENALLIEKAIRRGDQRWSNSS